jgi:hypothetical protein
MGELKALKRRYELWKIRSYLPGFRETVREVIMVKLSAVPLPPSVAPETPAGGTAPYALILE